MYKTVGTGVAGSRDETLQLDSEKNRIGTFDVIGNPTDGIWDVMNRFVKKNTVGEMNAHGYDPGNKKVVRVHTTASVTTREISFYAGDNRLGKYGLTTSNGVWTVTTLEEERYFAGRRLMPQDRLGSAADAWLTPYGKEMFSGLKPITPNNKVKFATYYRDAVTGDYADQRYYRVGRFSTPDPYMASGGTASPSSWNRYTYTRGDPVNRYDPRGLEDEEPGSGSPLIWCPYMGTMTTEALCALASAQDPNTSPPMKICMDGSTRLPQEPCPEPVAESPVKVSNLKKSGRNYDTARQRFEDVRGALDEDCAGYLSGAVAYIDGLIGGNLLAVADFDPSIAAFTGTEGTTIAPGEAAMVVNNRSAFFDSRYRVGPSNKYVGGTSVAQVFILLHELGHAVSAADFRSDYGHTSNGVHNDRLIEQHCAKTLRSFQ
jgi:RHS repeat-associated protein